MWEKLESLGTNTFIRPIQVRLGPTQLHHSERYQDVTWHWQLFNFGFIQAGMEHHGSVTDCLLILNIEQLPNKEMDLGEMKRIQWYYFSKSLLLVLLYIIQHFQYCVMEKLCICGAKTYRKRSGKLCFQISSLHVWFPAAMLPRNWMPQRRAGWHGGGW